MYTVWYSICLTIIATKRNIIDTFFQIHLTTGDLTNQEDCARIVHDSMAYFNGQLDVLVCYPALTPYGVDIWSETSIFSFILVTLGI